MVTNDMLEEVVVKLTPVIFFVGFRSSDISSIGLSQNYLKWITKFITLNMCHFQKQIMDVRIYYIQRFESIRQVFHFKINMG